MKKVVSVLLCLGMLCLSACSKKDDSDVLYMATECTFQPFEYLDNGKAVGIDVEIAEAIANKLGKKLVVEDIDFETIIPSIQSHKYDFAMAGLTVTEERAEQVNFSDSYATGVQVVIVNEDFSISDVSQLYEQGHDYQVGCQAGTTGFLYATWDIEDEGYGSVKSYQRTTDAAQALVDKKIDCIVLDNEPAKAIVKNYPGLKILDTEYIVEDYAIAIAKDNEQLFNDINKALTELKADGTVDAILTKYIG